MPESPAPDTRSGRSDAESVTSARSAERSAERRQAEWFDDAAALFQAGKYGLASRILKRVQAGPDAALGHRARIYLEICKKKRAAKRPTLDSAEDHYNYAVELVNDRKLDEALRVIRKGLSKDPNRAHLHYLKAVVKVLAGESRSAYQPLKKAISLDPATRILARRDPDLRAVVRRKPFATLVFGNRP